MLNTAKALIKFLRRRGYDIFFIGGKSRTDLHNAYHPNNKMLVQDIDLITNADIEDI